MFEIKGKMNTAVCFASLVEDEAVAQIRRMCDYDFTAGSKVRIMPDVHAFCRFFVTVSKSRNREG